jgi:hypothetical protein
MKKILMMLSISILLFGFISSNAQVRMNVNVNIGQQPAWGPRGYDYVEYYYLPEVDAYYYVPAREFVYLDHGRWISASSLPYTYRDYDLYRGYKVVVNEPKPYMRHDYYRSRYAGNNRAVVIKNIRDDGGYNKKAWKGKKGHGKGHANGHYK